MDVSDLFKRHLANMNKGNTNTYMNKAEERKEDIRKERRMKRDTLTYARRNIDVNMSPFETPPVERKSSKKVNENNIDKTYVELVNKRLELLAKWKAEKAKKKQQEMAKKKPVFKVCHVSSNILSMAGNKSQFAPGNHTFRAPSGIKPVASISNTNTVTKSQNRVENKPTKSIPKPQIFSSTPFTSKPLASKTATPLTTSINPRGLSKIKSEPDVKKVNNSKTSVSQTRSTTNLIGRSRGPVTPKPPTTINSKLKTTPNVTATQNKVTQNNVRNLKKTPNTSSNKHEPTKSLTKTLSNLKIDSNTSKVTKKESIKKTVQKTSENLSKEPEEVKISPSFGDNSDREKAPGPNSNYVSPFVTISRGKRASIKEFKVRRSLGSEALTPEVRDDIFSDATSIQAGAQYFMHKLDSEIERINKICRGWEVCLEDPQLPEEATASIDVAIGQSKLLIAKKFEQFRGLIVQCETKNYEEKEITCEDLHGFWDMVYMQVEDLDKRFANLDRLKSNNWEEILPVKKNPIRKAPINKPKAPATKKPSGTSRLKDLIKAARQKHKGGNEMVTEEVKVFDGVMFKVKTPVKQQQIPQPSRSSCSVSKRKSLRVSILQSIENKKRCSSSPGLTMMKVSQSIKQNNGLTPAKSILKMDGCKSTGKKSVAFKDSPSPKFLRKTKLFGQEVSDFSEGDKENSPCALRRSSRLAKV